LGLIEWKHANLKEACDYFYNALPYFQQLEDKSFLANLYNNLGLLFSETGDLKKTLSFQLKALQIYKSINDDEHIGATCTNLSNVYLNLNKLDSCEYFIKESINYSSKINDQYGLSIAYITYSDLLSQKEFKKYDEAISFLLKALKIKEEMNEVEGVVHVYISIAEIYLTKEDWTNFLKYNYSALNISKKNNFLIKKRFTIT
jgi:tetratricopeptide (TPR) repeat protein